MDAKLHEAWCCPGPEGSQTGEAQGRSSTSKTRRNGGGSLWQDALRRGYKIVEARWTDLNKDDSFNKEHRMEVDMWQKNSSLEMKIFFHQHQPLESCDSSSAMQPPGTRRATRESCFGEDVSRHSKENNVCRVTWRRYTWGRGRRTSATKVFTGSGMRAPTSRRRSGRCWRRRGSRDR